MARRQRSPAEIDQIRERILDAAHELIVAGGPHHVTMRRIGARLGVSHMTLYSYFQNHEDLMRALRERQMARMAAQQEENLRRAEAGEVEQVIRDELQRFRQFAAERPALYRFALAGGVAQSARPHRQAHGMGRILKFSQHLEQLIKIGIVQGRFSPRDPALAARVVLSVINAPLLLHALGCLIESEQLDEVWNETSALVMRYLALGITCQIPGNDERILS